MKSRRLGAIVLGTFWLMGAEAADPGALPRMVVKEPSLSALGLGSTTGSFFPLDPAVYCRYPSEPLETVHADSVPNYFFKTCPSTGEIFYATGLGKPGFIDPKNSGSAFHPLPGSVDPVPSTDPGCRALVVMGEDNRVRIFDTAEARRGVTQAPLYADQGFEGMYPSVGVLRRSPSDGAAGFRMRVLLDREQSFGDSGLYFRDYRVGGGAGDRRRTVRPAGPVTRVCGNDPHFADLRMPMLSPDGRKASFFDTRDNMGVVATIEPDGSCRAGKRVQIADPGYGKASFNANGTKLAYSSSSFNRHARVDKNEPDTYYMPISDKAMHSQVHVLDLGSGKDVKITDWVDANALYPTWNGDRVIAQRERFIEGHAWPSTDFVTLRAEPIVAPEMPQLGEGCAPASPSAILQIAALWSGVCEKGAVTGGDASIAAVMRLPAERCAEMVEREWAGFRGRVTKRLDEFGIPKELQGSPMSAEDLAAACPAIAKGR